MSASFDGYHEWLGIPPTEPPPNHYRLLQLAPLEEDAGTIRQAADRILSNLQTHASGPNSDSCAKITRHVEKAASCLLDPSAKATYDARLRSRGVVAGQPSPAPFPPSAASSSTMRPSAMRPAPDAPGPAATSSPSSPRTSRPPVSSPPADSPPADLPPTPPPGIPGSDRPATAPRNAPPPLPKSRPASGAPSRLLPMRPSPRRSAGETPRSDAAVPSSTPLPTSAPDHRAQTYGLDDDTSDLTLEGDLLGDAARWTTPAAPAGFDPGVPVTSPPDSGLNYPATPASAPNLAASSPAGLGPSVQAYHPDPTATHSASAQPVAVDDDDSDAAWRTATLQDMPAFFVSALTHMVLLIVLALLTIPPVEPETVFSLTASLSKEADTDEGTADAAVEIAADEDTEPMPVDEPEPEPAEDKPAETPDNEPQPDKPDDESPADDAVDAEYLAALAKATESSRAAFDRSLQRTQRVIMGQGMGLRSVVAVRDEIQSADGHRHMLAARDPRVRAEVVAKEGGNGASEAAVHLGLKWLARHQMSNGSWSLNHFHESTGCDGNCGAASKWTSDVAASSLALLAFLGAGQTHDYGDFQDEVNDGLNWLLAMQKGNGSYVYQGHGRRMYAHGLATIALCEAYALTTDSSLEEPAQKAINFIVKAQHSAGGWRYGAYQPGDTSVTGWQIMALHSGKTAGLQVPENAMRSARRFIDSTHHRDRTRYCYMPHNYKPNAAMTSVGLLSRIYFGVKKTDGGLTKGVTYLSDHPPKRSGWDEYYVYYGSQVMHHYGGLKWTRWNRVVRDTLVATQEKRGCEAGSWNPRAMNPTWVGRDGGRLYFTALSICTLEVYYRHLPMFRRIPLDG